MATHAGESEEPQDEPYKENEHIKEEEEWTHRDEGVSLVIQRLLHTPKKENEIERHSIFKTRCTIDKRICDSIIDSGSSKNIVSKTMVDKLQFKTHKHPSTYRIGWIKELESLK